jgi:hypothetical protein
MTRNELVKAGYCKSPNLPAFGQLGHNWYASGPGVIEPPTGVDMYVGDKFRFYRVAVVGTVDIWPLKIEAQLIAECNGLSEAVAWMTTHGKISEGGAPAYANSWD